MIDVLLGVVTAAAYIWAVRAYDMRYPHHRLGVTRAAAFCAGVTLAVVALLPPFDALVDSSFAAHMVQHLTLMLIVPPLLLMGAPLLPIVALPAPAAGRRMARIVRSPLMLVLASPAIAWLTFVATMWCVHFSPLYELALRSEGAHVTEHALLLGTALLFWMPVVQTGYSPSPTSFPARMFYLFLAIPQGAFLGLTIYSSRYVLYPHYLLGRSYAAALSDQHNAGAIMWIGGGALLFVAFMLVAVVWAVREHREDVFA